MAAAATAGGDSEAEFVTVRRLRVWPNPARVSDELHLEAHVTLRTAVRGAYWEMSYIVDSVRRRFIVALGRTATTDYAAGPISFEFGVAHIDVGHLKPSHLSNVGLLTATLHGVESGGSGSGGGDAPEIGSIQVVVQATAGAAGEEPTRCVLNPWEESEADAAA